jgi:hypothetical protein
MKRFLLFFAATAISTLGMAQTKTVTTPAKKVVTPAKTSAAPVKTMVTPAPLFKNQIDSLKKIINESDSIISTLQLKVDSLEVKKITIINNYNEKVSVIRDASAAEHARWFESVIRNLEDYRELK